MNKLKYIIIAILLGGFVRAQDELNLPNYTPPSPEASAMTKYADLQANEFKGMVSHTIPLYTYKAGQLEVPISISYNGAGVRVDDIPTWVGMNWTLNAGGVITRTVKDIADESTGSIHRVVITDANISNYTGVNDGTTEGNHVWNLINNNQYDTEVDIFQFNFNGISGSFYLDENWQVRLTKDNQNLKINVGSKSDLLNNKIIEIVDSNGIKYTFGGTSATEETSIRNVVNGSLTGETFQGVTAFYLTKIEHPIYGEINFKYESLSMQNLSIQKIQKRSRVIDFFDLGFTPEGPTCTNSENPYNVQSSLITTSSRIISPKYLTRVYSPNTSEEIIFSSEKVDNPSFKRVLNSIVIDKDSLNQPFKTIDFEYYGFSPNPNFPATTRYAEKRFFLTKITFDKDVLYAANTANGRRNQVYEFEYNNSGALPNRFDYAQDFLGYFNGKSNTTGIPNHPVFNPYGNENVADRTPDFNYAQAGALKRIYYPTGGYTEFDYEAAGKAKKELTKSVVLYAWRNMGQYSFTPNNKLSDGVPQIDSGGNYIGIQNVYESQPVVINVKLKAHREQGDVILNQNERATLTMKDLTTGNETTELLTMNSDGQGLNPAGIVEKDFTVNYGFFQGHDYQITITINSTTSSDPIGMEANLYVSYSNGYEIVDNLGVRLKRTTDYANNEEPENIKRYYYTEIEKVDDPIDLNLLPIQGEGGEDIKTDSYISNKICLSNPDASVDGLHEIWYQYLNIYSDKTSFGSNYEVNSYEYVTISLGGDNFERGGIEKNFTLFTDYDLTEMNTYASGSQVSNSWYLISGVKEFIEQYKGNPSPHNGTLKKEKVFKNENSILKKIIEKNFDYIYPLSNKVSNLVAKKEFETIWLESGETISNVVSNYTVGLYMTDSKQSVLTQKQTIEYIDPVPLGVTDESSYNKIVSLEEYDYGFYNGLPTKITTTTSDGSLVEVNNFYVDQVASSNYQTGLTSDQVQAAQELQNKHIISAPILIEKVKNSKIISKLKTIYQDLDSNPNSAKIVPAIIQSDKGEEYGSQFEDRVVFHEYDNSGRPTLVSLANGSKTRYWYNGLGQVIMKIDNFIPGTGGTIDPDDIIDGTTTSPCGYLDSAFGVDAQVTLYKYEPVTNLLIEIRDTKCNVLYYEYDPLHRLQFIKDKDGNILQEFDLSFKRY